MTTNSNFRVKNGLEVAQDVKINTIKLRDNAGILDAYKETITEAVTGTLLFLYNFNNDTTDDTGNTELTLNGECAISDAQNQFGGGSLLVGTTVSSANYASVSEVVSNSINIAINEDFTFEAWYYPTALDSYDFGILQANNLIFFVVGNGPNNEGGINYGGQIGLYNGSTNPTGTAQIVLNSWNHIVWSRKNGNLYLAVNGVVENLGAIIPDAITSGDIKIGSDPYGNQSVEGYLDSVRLIKGFALYTENYTMPSIEPSISDNIGSPMIITTSTAYPSISAFTNDVGYAIGTIPTTISQLTNDVGYITTSSVPTTISQLSNDVGFFTNTNFAQVDIGTIKLRDNNGLLNAYTENVVTEQISTGTQVFLYNFNSILTDDTGNTSLTTAGDTAVVDTYTKFGGGSLYVGSTAGNSNYAAISQDVSGIFDIGLGDYTLEGWVYIPSGGGYNWGFMQMGTPIWGIQRGLGDARPSYWNGSTYLNTAIAIPPNEWAHISWSRKDGNLYASINGVVEFIETDASDIQYNANAMIGSDAYPNESFEGYIDSIRLVKGIALYTENFTVPSVEPSASDVFYITNTYTNQTSALPTALSELTNDVGFTALNTGSNVSINTITLNDNIQLLPTTVFFTNADQGFVDLTGNDTLTNNGVVLDSTSPKFGSNSAYWSDRSGNFYLKYEGNTLNLGNGDFTWDAWVRPDSTLMADGGIGSTLVNFSNGVRLEFQYNGITYNGLYIVSSTGGSGGNFLAGEVIPDTWNHITIMTVSGVTWVGINGVMSNTGLGAFDLTSPMYIGHNERIAPASDFGGWMDNIRLSNAAIFSTEGYTPPGELDYYQISLGRLTLPLGGIIQETTSTNGSQVTITPGGTGPQLSIYPTTTEGNHLHLTSENLTVTSLFLGDDAQYIRTGLDGSIVIGTNDSIPDNVGYGNRWKFDANGVITFPSQSANNRTGSGDALIFAKDNLGQKIIATQNGNVTDNTVERLVIAGGDGFNTGEGGDIYLWAGRSGSAGGSGGDIKVDSGDAYDSQGGTVKIRGGNAYNGENSAIADGGWIEVKAGSSYNGGSGGNLNLIAGNSYNGTGSSGDVIVQTNAGNWTFSATGSLSLPPNTSHITFDSANGDVVYMSGGDQVTFAGFSGEILVNDLYNGYVYKFLVGGGYCTLIGHTNAAAIETPETITVGPVNEACGITNWVDMTFTGDYVFTNLNYDVSRYYSFVTIRSRDGS